MKVLMVYQNDPIRTIGGIQTHIRKLSHELVKLNCQVEFFSDSIKLPLSHRWLKHESLRSKLSDFKPDIVHVHGFTSLFAQQAISLTTKLNIDVVYTSHYHPFQYHRLPFLAKLLFENFTSNNLKRIKSNICLTDYECKFFENKSKLNCVIPNGHSITQDTISKLQASKPLVNGNYYLFIGRDHSNKGIDEFIELAKTTKKDFKFVAVCNTERDISPCTKLKGVSDEDLQNLIFYSKALIVPSKYEAFSLVALDACILETPVVSSPNVMAKSFFDGSKNEFYIVNDLIEEFGELELRSVDKLNKELSFETSRFSWSEVAASTFNLAYRGN